MNQHKFLIFLSVFLISIPVHATELGSLKTEIEYLNQQYEEIKNIINSDVIIEIPLNELNICNLLHKVISQQPTSDLLQECYAKIQDGCHSLPLHEILAIMPELISFLQTQNMNECDDNNGRAPRPGAQSATASDAIVGKSECDLTQVLGLLGSIKKRIQILQEIICDKFEQTWTILAEIDQDIFDTRTILCAKFEGTFTSLEAIEQEIIDTRTILCTKFEGTFTSLEAIEQEIIDTRTILCTKFEGTFTGLETIEQEVIDTRTILCDKFEQTWTILGALEGCDKNVIQISSAPFTITSPGVYCLTQNLFMPAGNAITIISDDVVLDLNDYEIIGNQVAPVGTGILIQGSRRNIRIQNGKIIFFNRGIHFNSAGGAIFEVITLNNIIAENNALGFDCEFLETFKISNCTAYKNNTFDGFSFRDSREGTLISCNSNENAAAGFNLTTNNRNIELIQCSAYLNFGQGIRIDVNCNRIIFDSCVSNENSHGFSVIDARNIELVECTAHNNTSQGILFLGSSQSVIQSCVANNDLDGFRLENCESIVIKECEAINNTTAGFSLDALTANCHLRRNVAIANGIGFAQAALGTSQIYLNFAINNGGGLANYLGVPPGLVNMPTDATSGLFDDFIANTSQ